MPVNTLNELLKQAELLTRMEQLQLAVRLIRRTQPPETPPMKWKDICGLIPYPAIGEDARIWVSRNRIESDSEREKR